MLQSFRNFRSFPPLALLAMAHVLLTLPANAAQRTQGSPETPCGEIVSDIDLSALPRPAIILVGEWHGTREGPQAVGDIACSLVARGIRVAVLLEMSESQADLLASLDGGSDDRQRLCAGLSSTLWSIDGDGRSSLAIAQLALDAVRYGRELGNPVTLGAMDANSWSQRPDGVGIAAWRHIRMAANILAYSGSHDVVVVNLGNAHPAAVAQHLLEGAGSETVSVLKLRQVYQAGTAWNCQASGCGEHVETPAAAYSYFIFSIAPEIQATNELSGYDGALNIGPITASPPVAQTDFCAGDLPGR